MERVRIAALLRDVGEVGVAESILNKPGPLEGRIVAVADAYAALTAERPYRQPFSEQRARAELQARAGTQFDHDVVEAFLAIDGRLGPEAELDASTSGAE